MHQVQEKILKLAEKKDISNTGLRELARLLDVEHPQIVKHHFEQLKKKGLIYTDLKTKKIIIAEPRGYKIAKILNIPILGSANCGEANVFAYENIEGYLKVSAGIVGKKNIDGLFIVRAIGDSLNQAKNLNGGPVENGDYIVIDGKNRNPKNGDYVLSIIDEAANLKRYYRTNKEIRLVSESNLNIPPIVLHEDDIKTPNYLINGVVLKVIKK
ncbi:hypothetical protein KAJ41_01105 [Candidatus Parcubacteria bacterium]|nr:hypothetical protein [Candidatus Parcubacteria bacterium]